MVDGVVGKIVRSVIAGKVAVAGDPTDNRDFRSDPVVKNVVDSQQVVMAGHIKRIRKRIRFAQENQRNRRRPHDSPVTSCLEPFNVLLRTILLVSLNH